MGCKVHEGATPVLEELDGGDRVVPKYHSDEVDGANLPI